MPQRSWNGGTEAVDAGVVGDVEGNEGRRLAARLLDLVVEFLEGADSARHCNNVRTGGRQPERSGAADTSRGATTE